MFIISPHHSQSPPFNTIKAVVDVSCDSCLFSGGVGTFGSLSHSHSSCSSCRTGDFKQKRLLGRKHQHDLDPDFPLPTNCPPPCNKPWLSVSGHRDLRGPAVLMYHRPLHNRTRTGCAYFVCSQKPLKPPPRNDYIALRHETMSHHTTSHEQGEA